MVLAIENNRNNIIQWHSYPPKPTVKSIIAFFKLVEEDDHACFFAYIVILLFL